MECHLRMSSPELEFNIIPRSPLYIRRNVSTGNFTRWNMMNGNITRRNDTRKFRNVISRLVIFLVCESFEGGQ